MLAAADSDKDKQISEDEFVSHITNSDPALPKDEVLLIFSEIDEDHDKRITIRELTLHWDEFESNRAESEFYNVDASGDAKVDADEFVKFYKDSQSDLSEEKTRARFKDVDTNHDGHIDVKEAKETWDRFEPDNIAGGKKPRKRKSPKINRHKVASRAKDQLQAVFRIESDKAELGSILAGNELKDIGDKLKALGIENAADLGHLTEAEMGTLGLNPVQMGKLKQLVDKYRLKAATSRALLSVHAGDAEDEARGGAEGEAGAGAAGQATSTGGGAKAALMGASAASVRAPLHADVGREPRERARRVGRRAGASRRLLQTDPAVGDEGSAGAGAERRDDSDVPLDDVEIPEGVAVQSNNGDNGDTGGDGGRMGDKSEPQVPAAPLDGQEFVDGETYKEEDESDDPYDYYPRYRYHDHDDMYYEYNADTIASQQAKDKYEQKLEGWKNVPLSHNSDSQWGHMKGFFAPEAPDSEDLAFRGEHIKSTILGHDEVFSRMMSIDKDIILQAKKINNTNKKDILLQANRHNSSSNLIQSNPI
jgi:Ca2+-binding EF-hand superfamily protein